MNQYFKVLFLIVVFPLLTLLTGCNSEGAFSGSESTVKLERIDITASPITTKGVSQLTLAVENDQPFEAVGHYSDGSFSTLTDLTVSDWHTSDSKVGRFDKPGVFTATNEGYTTVMATKDGVTSNTVSVDVSAAVITSIQVTPSPVKVAKGQTQQLTATATYNDGSWYDISSSGTTWGDFDTDTVTVSSTGLLFAVEVGSTTLTATKDGIISDAVDVDVDVDVDARADLDVDVCADLAGTCIDIFDTGRGKLFTNSPSKPYLDSIGGSAATNGTKYQDGTYGSFTYGPVGEFYLFNWTNANTLCTTYNTLSLGGRTNWRLPTKDEVKVELYDVFRNMFTRRGWPTRVPYWSVTPSRYQRIYPDRHGAVTLSAGKSANSPSRYTFYAGCVSNP